MTPPYRTLAKPSSARVADTRPPRPRLEWRALALAFVAAWSTFNPDTALRYGAVLCGLIFLSLGHRARIRRADVLALALTLWTALSLTWALDPDVALLTLKNQLAVLAIFLAVRSAVTTSRQLAIVALGYLAGCTYTLYLLVEQNRQTLFVPELGAGRLGIQGVNFNYMAYALTTGLVLLVAIWQIHRPGPGLRSLLVLIAPVLCFGLVKSGSRGAVIGAALIALWIVAKRIWPGLGAAVPIAAFSIAALATFTGWADGALLVLDHSSTRSTGDLAGRLSTWPYAREYVAAHPLEGIGGGGLRAANPYGIGAHNVPLEVASGLGIVGLALLTAVVYSALVTETRSVDPRARSLVVGALIVVSGPIILSGHWELSPSGWLALALISRIAVLEPEHGPVGAQVTEGRSRPWGGRSEEMRR